MARQEREILERAVQAVAEQAAKADELVDEAIAAGLDGSHQVTIHAKMLRLELLQVKAELERNLGALVLDWSDCGRLIHWVAGLGPDIGPTESPRRTASPPSSLPAASERAAASASTHPEPPRAYKNRASRLPGLPWARHVVMAPAQDPEYNRAKSDHSMLVVNVQSLAERLGIRFWPVAEPDSAHQTSDRCRLWSEETLIRR